jgi:hypothetical protein
MPTLTTADAVALSPVQSLPRHCGGCTACCTLYAVSALAKPARHPCPHAAGGCTIYRDRPEECRGFACGWLAGLGRDRDRPAESGVVIDLVWRSPRAVRVRALCLHPTVDALTIERLLAEAIARLALAGVDATPEVHAVPDGLRFPGNQIA